MDINFKQIRLNETVQGKVIRVNPNDLRLDINYSLEGLMYLDQFDVIKHDSFEGLVAEGDMIEAVVKKIDEMHGQVLLSRIPIVHDETFKQLIKDYEKGNLLKAKVKAIAPAGLLFDVKGHEVFMHESQVDFETGDLSSYIGKELSFYITELDERRKKVKASRTKHLVEQRSEARAKEFASLKVGQTVTGTISGIKPFGVFVDLGYNQALIPISELTHERIESIEAQFSLGDKVDAQVIEVKKQNGRNRIALSRKRLLPTPFSLFAKDHKVGQTIEGTVINKLPFGVIVEVAPHVSGLLHNNEISYNPNDNFKASVVHGTSLQVVILELDKKRERISLSRKALEDNPWAKVTVKRGDIVTGVISAINIGKGFSVTIQGVDADLSVDELKEGPVGKLEDLYQVGDSVEVLVTTCEPREWVMEVSIRRLQAKRERKQFDTYIKTQETRSVTLGELFGSVLEKKKTSAEPAKKAPVKKASPKASPTVDVSTLSVSELKAQAKAKGIAGYSTMKKAELIKALG
jgi:small subunit ribosomal protein S1